MAAGDVLFAATGITDGSLFAGVRFERDSAHDLLDRNALGDRHAALDPRRATGTERSGLRRI